MSQILHVPCRTASAVFRPSLCLVLLLLTPMALPVWGQDDAASSPSEEPVATIEDEIVISSSMRPLPRRSSGSSLTVFDREEIERRQETTVLELLRTVPGLEVSQLGGPGRASSVFIRGGNSSHTLVLVDGVRVNANGTGAFDFADLTTDNLERVEVLRGPQGVLYGSEAVSGVVSIFTRRGDGPAEGWIRGEVGTEDSVRFGAGVSGGQRNIDYSLAVSSLSSDGLSAASEAAGNPETDRWQNLTLSGRMGTVVWGDGRLDLALRYSDGESEVDGFSFGVGPVDDLNALQDHTLFSGALTLSKPITEMWTQKLMLSNSQDDLTGEDPDDFFSNFEILSQTSALTTQADLTLSDIHSMSLGYRFERRQDKNVGSYDEQVDISSFFGESLWSWSERFNVSLGLRHDDYSSFGNETTYRLALSADLGDLVRMHGSAGSGYKAPGFADLYFPFFGNPDLQPETSQGFDLGFEVAAEDRSWIVDVTYFDTDFEDLILFTFPAGIVNVAEATSSGVELTLAWLPRDSWSLSVSHTYNDTEDLASGLQLARRPENRTTLSLSFDLWERLRGSATVIAGSDRIDSDGSDMEDYERLDLALDYRWTERLRPFLRFENLLDADEAEVPGYTTPGASATVGMKVVL